MHYISFLETRRLCDVEDQRSFLRKSASRFIDRIFGIVQRHNFIPRKETADTLITFEHDRITDKLLGIMPTKASV